ncbi:phage holin family protein [Aggregatibacter actinomycetemcomitans]|uniref:phage holin family protein n=1 Tax=Aggregatibacter actinomycetemcomitans TaxID=714 RepID=UPI001E302963|nr:phage holin family protein [Aggregatibacter actinomycetemcomitans]
MQQNGQLNGTIDVVTSVIAFLFSGLGGIVKCITTAEAEGDKVRIATVASSFFIGAFSGMVVAFFLMSQKIDTLMIISIAGAFGYFGVPALWGLLRVFFRQIGGTVDDLKSGYQLKNIEKQELPDEKDEDVTEYDELPPKRKTSRRKPK